LTRATKCARGAGKRTWPNRGRDPMGQGTSAAAAIDPDTPCAIGEAAAAAIDPPMSDWKEIGARRAESGDGVRGGACARGGVRGGWMGAKAACAGCGAQAACAGWGGAPGPRGCRRTAGPRGNAACRWLDHPPPPSCSAVPCEDAVTRPSPRRRLGVRQQRRADASARGRARAKHAGSGEETHRFISR
jgi:hypothetical protein